MTKDGKIKVEEIITEQILAALDSGVAPWQQPWAAAGAHTNLKSKKAYRGINQLLLGFSAMSQGFGSPYWVSYKQAEAMGGQVRKGEKSTIVTFWKRLKIEEKQPDNTKLEKTIGLLRYYRVFNVEQCDGLEGKIPAVPEAVEFDPIEAAEEIVAGMPNCPPIQNGGDAAFYSPSADKVGMPKRESFKSGEAYYASLLHELVHSTGHTSRLNRDGVMKSAGFGSEVYSKEELVAEIGAAFLCGHSGILDIVFDNSASYIKSWRDKIAADPKLIVKAAGEAQKATDYILGITWDNDKGEDN